MRIAVFHELPLGGARRAVNEFSSRLHKTHTVDLYSTDTASFKEERKYFSKVYRYPFIEKEWRGNNWKRRLYKDTVELYRLYILHKRIAKAINKRKYDIVFVHASKYIQTPFLLRFPIKNKVFYLHDPYYRIAYEQITFPQDIDGVRYIYEKTNRYIRKFLDKRNMSGASYVFANSNFTKKLFEKTYKKKSSVCYLGVNTSTFRPNKVKKDIDILFIGSYQKLDGYPLLTKTKQFLRKDRKVKVVAMEDTWIDTDEELRLLYNKSKAVIALAKNEPLGLVPLEAMACSVPVIAINEGGYKETVIDKKTGFLIERDAKKIAICIERFLKNEKLQAQMAKDARTHVVDRWSWETRTRELEKNFTRITSV